MTTALSDVAGLEAMAVTYNEFFRFFVQRKRQELVNPQFHGIGEISLPRNSLIHFLPRNGEDYGPSTSEAFISNYTGEVFIDFVSTFTPVMGSGRSLPIEIKKAIQAYRGTHYVYQWTQNIGTVYNKEKVLVVKNYGLTNRMWQPRPTVFVNYEMYYNHFSQMMNGINEESGRGDRKQFMRIDLPINLPGFADLSIDFDHYVRSFQNGLPVPNNQMVGAVKAESSYWLLDMLAFLFGDYEYSLFNKLTPKSLEALHLIFVSNSRCLVIHMATLKSWLDELYDQRYIEKTAAKNAEEEEKAKAKGKTYTPPQISHRAGHVKRLNVSKRVYLAFMNMIRDSVPELEVIKENENAGGAGKETQDPAVAGGASKAQKGKGQEPDQGRVGAVPGEVDTGPDNSDDRSLADVLSGVQKSNNGPDETEGGSGDRTSVEDAEEWTSEVDDSLLEQEKVVAEVSTNKDPFPSYESGIAAALEERAREGILTVAEQQFFMRKGTQFKHIELSNGQTMEEYAQVNPEDLKTLKADAEIKARLPVVIDKSMLRSRAKVLKQGYADKFLHKHTMMMILGLQNAGIAINDFRHEVVHGVEGVYDVYTIQLHPVDGEQGTYVIRVPRVAKDGSFTVDGVKSHMQLQRMERPIRKINKFKVALTSYYDIKLMVSRSQKRVDNLGEWLIKQIVHRAAQKDGGVSFNRGDSFNGDYDPPRLYTIMSAKFQWIKAGDLTLDFNIAKLLKEHPEFSKHTKPDDFLIGVKGSDPITIDSYGNLYVGGVNIGTLDGQLGISTAKAPTEYAVINIGGYMFPLGVVLCYYFGIDKLLSVTKATTRTVPIGTRAKLSEDEYAITFNDEHLIFNRREKLPTLIFGGMPRLNNISNFSRVNLNDQGVWVPLMGDPKVRPKQFQEMKNMHDLFIDPITKAELKRLGYSVSFPWLLLDAAKMLMTDWSRHEVELEEQRLVGYERFPGHIYREWCKAIRMYRNKGKGRKHKIDFNPEAVTMKIITDTSVNLVEEVNPVHQLKDQEEVTFGGVGGRGEISIVKRARVQLDSYRGVSRKRTRTVVRWASSPTPPVTHGSLTTAATSQWVRSLAFRVCLL